jgi:Ras-related GTP-binding protein A/B
MSGFSRVDYRQDSFMENYLNHQAADVFGGVALLIYVFDIESRDFPRDLETFTNVLEALYEGSPDARLFCLFHKMDLVQEELRESLFMERETILRQISHMFTDVVVLGTSIWDETLYKVPRKPSISILTL